MDKEVIYSEVIMHEDGTDFPISYNTQSNVLTGDMFEGWSLKDVKDFCKAALKFVDAVEKDIKKS